MATINRESSTSAPAPCEIVVTVHVSSNCAPETLKALGEMIRTITASEISQQTLPKSAASSNKVRGRKIEVR